MKFDNGKCSAYQGEPCPPRIGWKACEGGSFYLDGLPIKEATALHYWKHGGAIFGEFAAKRMRQIVAEEKQVAAWLRKREGAS